MKRYIFLGTLLLALVGFVSGVTVPLAAQGKRPAAPPTATPKLLPKLTRQPMQEITITSVEPQQLVSSVGGTLSVRGTGFTEACVLRLSGYGFLSTVYLNEKALTAQVPPGVPAGTYDVEVSDGVHEPAEAADALTIVAPTPTPRPQAPETPEPPPPPGQPVLTIRNYTVEPVQVRPGQEFVVSIEIYNNGSRAGENTLAIFPGGTFLPLGEKGHNLWQLHINQTVVVSQRMRAPKSISNGVHQLQVHLEANDYEGNNYAFPDTIPVEVVGASSGTFTGKPKVVIEDVATEPAVLIPGEPFSLTLRLANRGLRTAVNVFVTSGSSEMAIPAAGGDTLFADVIRIDDAVTVTLPLILGNLDVGGRQNMQIALEYSDYSGGSYGDQQNVGVDINTSLTKQPQLIVERYETLPDFIAPGDTFTLTLDLANVGGGDAQRVTLALGGEGGASLAPFIPLKSGNVIFIDSVAPGETVLLQRQLIIDGSADTKAYNLPIELAYDDPRASRHTDTQRLSLIVRKRPELQASFYRQPDRVMVGAPSSLSLEVINVGRSAVNVVEIAPSSPGMEVTLEGMPFVGPLDAGGSAPIDLRVVPQEDGAQDLVLAVTYRDDFNQEQVITKTLSVDVQGGGPPGPTGPGGALPGEPGQAPSPGSVAPGEDAEAPETIWQKLGRVVRGLLGLGS
jgi:hypothetical protein